MPVWIGKAGCILFAVFTGKHVFQSLWLLYQKEFSVSQRALKIIDGLRETVLE